MRHSRLPVFTLFLALAAFSLLATSAHATVTNIVSQKFTVSASNIPWKPTELDTGSDWWRFGATPNKFDNNLAIVSTIDNISLRLTSLTAGRYILSPAVSGEIGTLSFRMLISKAATGNNAPVVSVSLTSNPVLTTTTANNSTVQNALRSVQPVHVFDVDTSETNVWKTYTYTFNRQISASSPQRLLIGRLVSDEGYDVLIDDIVLQGAVATLSVEDELYATANGVAADPAAAITSVLACKPGTSDRSVAPYVSFTRYLEPFNIAVTNYWRVVPGGTWQAVPFTVATTNDGTGVITYALGNGSLPAGNQSGAQIEMYATATYENDAGVQSVPFSHTETNPLRIDVLPRSPRFDTHTNLVVAGTLEAPMDAATNGVWVGLYEHRGYASGASGTWRFDFGLGAASSSRSYGDDVSEIPFKGKGVTNGRTFPAPATLERDVIFRYEEPGQNTSEGTALLGVAQTFENWASAQDDGWVLANASGTSAVVTDETLALRGTHSLYLAAGDSLVLDKTAHPGVKEIGFWMRRADSSTNAAVTLLRHRAGTAIEQAETLATYTALPTDRYVFRSFTIDSTRNPMDTDGIGITATTAVYLDGVYVSDSSVASLVGGLSFDPEPPLHQGDSVAVSAEFSLEGGARFRDGDNKVAVVWGQGNSVASATNTLYASYNGESGAWTATLPVASGDMDLYVYVTADAFDFAGDPIGTITSATNCLPTAPASEHESLVVHRTVGGASDVTSMRLAADGFWKGAVAAPTSAQANVVFQFEDDEEILYGGEEGENEVPASGSIKTNGVVTAATVDTALALEFNENERTYNVRKAKYAPLDGALPAAGWSTEGTVAHTATGSVFQAGAKVVCLDNTGVGQVFFWARRMTAAAVNYKIEYNTSATGTTGWSSSGIDGASGTIASETIRFHVATVGNNDAKRIRITFTGGAVLVQDVVVTASGAYVSFANPKISTSTNEVNAVASVTTNGLTVPYDKPPSIWVDVAPGNEARNIHVSVESIPVDETGTPLAGAEVALLPMEGNPAGGTFEKQMPTLPAGLIGYRFVATYEGIDATRTTYPASGYYVYEIDAALDTIRTPNISAIPFNVDQNNTRNAQNWRFVNVYVNRFETNSVAFQPEARVSEVKSRQPFNGIGRIYFKAFKQIEYDRSWVPHRLAVQISDTGGDDTWETINIVEVPFGMEEKDATQFCIEVDDLDVRYSTKYIRFVRVTSDDDPVCYLYLSDIVVTPPSANIELSVPSIIHPGYPSQHDDITFRVNIANVYDDYPAVAYRPVLRWRRYTGAKAGTWRETEMASVDGSLFECTLPAMAPGRVEYYIETHFSGAAYDYTTSDKYVAGMPYKFYYIWDNTEVEGGDPKNGREGSSPSFLFAKEESPAEFSIEAQQRELKGPGEVEGDSLTPYLWFKIRTFTSHHHELQFVYTNSMEVVEVEEGEPVPPPTWYTNSLQLVGDETWLTTISVPESVRFFGHILGVDPYEGAATTNYGTHPTTWGDRNQPMVNTPLASVADEDVTVDAVPSIEAYLGTEEPVLMMVRLDTTTGSYQIRRAAYQDFNDWTADPTYFEDSTGLYDTMTYEETFDTSAMFPLTPMEFQQMTFTEEDTRGEAVVFPGANSELDTHYTSEGWRLRNSWILREREPNAGTTNRQNVAAVIEPHAGYLENSSGLSALADGLDYVSFRYRSSIGGNGHLPYYKGGFDWKNYVVRLDNVRVTQMSPAHPYIQVIAGYADEDNYVAMRLTQMRELGSTKVQSWIKQELIKVQNGVESVVAAKSAKNYANPSGNVMSNRFDNLELTGGAWILSLAVTNNAIDGRAYPAWVASGANRVTNVLFAAGGLTGASADGGTISLDAFDALASFGGISVRAVGDATNSMTKAEKWNLGGTQKGGTDTRWDSSASGVSNKMPPLPFSIGVCKAGASSSFPGEGTYETVYTGNAGSLAYATVTEPVHYWGNTFVRIAAQSSDARLVVDDVETKAWHGKNLPEEAPDDDRYWQAREAVVVTRSGSRQLALTTSRANPSMRQMVSTPEMLEGIGTISFNYEVDGGTVKFVVERNTVSGSYGDDSGYTKVGDEIVAHSGAKGEVFFPIREDMRGKIRVRVIQEESDPDATLYIDNLFAKGFPPDDGRSWTAYNALIVAPTRNDTADERQFEEDITTQSSFLNNGTTVGTRPNNPLLDHMPYIQSPVIGTGVGEIGFWYRVWDASMKGIDGETIPGKLTLWVAPATSAEEREWRQITVDDLAKPEEPAGNAPDSEWESYNEKLAAYEEQKAQFDNLSSITNGTYQYFTAEICNDTNYVLRICCDTNGTQRVAIDNVLVTEPVRASIDILSVGMYPNDIPLVNEKVGFKVRLGNPRMNPTDIHVFADYYIGTNVWGVINWASNPDGAIELVQDPNDEYLYLSDPGDMIRGLPVDSVVQYRVRVTYTGTFASPVVDSSFDNPKWYEPVDLNKIYGTEPGTTNIVNSSPYYWVFSCPTGVVHINEFYAAVSGRSDTYTNEFVEIIGPKNLSLKGWKLDIVDGGSNSRVEDYVLFTYDYPDDATLVGTDNDNGWGFFVVGDTGGGTVSAIVNGSWTAPADPNLPVPGAIRLRRSMGAYVELISYGSQNDVCANEMVNDGRGYVWAGARSTMSSSNRSRAWALLTKTVEDDEVFEFRLATLSEGPTPGAMNTPEAIELLGECPYTVTSEFLDASATALTAYFDKHLPADFLIALTLGNKEEQSLTAVTVDETPLVLGTGFTSEVTATNENVFVVTLKADALAALDLATNKTHTVKLTVTNSVAPMVELVVTDSTSGSGNRSTRIVPSITDFQIEDGQAILTLTFANEGQAGSTAEGWKWTIVQSGNLGFAPATTNEWTALTDKDIGVEKTATINIPDADEQFYKAVTSDAAP